MKELEALTSEYLAPQIGPNDIFGQVLGLKRGAHVKALGMGTRPSKTYGISSFTAKSQALTEVKTVRTLLS